MATSDDLAEVSQILGAVIAQVKPEQLDLPTPCSEWDVRALIQHIIFGNHWYVGISQGASAKEAAQAVTWVSTGQDAADYAAFSATVQAIYRDPEALTRNVQHRVGPIPGQQALDMRTGDDLVHAWDLAQAIGAELVLPDHLVALGLALYEPLEQVLPVTGMFGQGAQGAPEATTPLERLLTLTGRRPS